MNQELMERLTNFLNDHPELRGQPATNEEITNAENELGVTMDDDFKEFIKKFGGAYAGIQIHAFKNGSSIGKETVIDLTKMGRNLLNQMELFPEINECYVIADDGNGNPVAMTKAGEVVLFDHDTEEKTVLSNTFQNFIEENFSEW
jgi:cell wall assembly regulator SMI1